MIDKSVTQDDNKVDILKSKVHLATRLLEDKHEENSEIKQDLTSKRSKLNQAESEFFDKKQQLSKLRTGKTHSNIDIDYAERKKNNMNKKFMRKNDIKKLNEDNLELLKTEYRNLK